MFSPPVHIFFLARNREGVSLNDLVFQLFHRFPNLIEIFQGKVLSFFYTYLCRDLAPDPPEAVLEVFFPTCKCSPVP